MSSGRYAPREIEFIKKNYSRVPVKIIAEKLGRSEKGIRNKIERLGINLSSLNRRHGKWTDEETNLLKQFYRKFSDKEIALKLSRTTGSISAKREALSLRKYRQKDEEGKYLDSDGYYKIYDGRGNRRFYHVVIAEKSLGRPITREEKVHHINFDKTDNRKENLFVCRNKSHHFKLHFQSMEILGILVKKNIVKFDREREEYCLRACMRSRA